MYVVNVVDAAGLRHKLLVYCDSHPVTSISCSSGREKFSSEHRLLGGKKIIMHCQMSGVRGHH